MSTRNTNNEGNMLSKMIEIEKRKARISGSLPGMAAEDADRLTKRLLLEKQSILGKRNAMANHKMPDQVRPFAAWILPAIAAIALFSIGIVFFQSREANPRVRVVHTAGGGQFGNSQLSAGAMISAGQTVVTHPGSIAVLAVGQELQAVQLPDSSFSFAVLAHSQGKTNVEIADLTGAIFFSAKKGAITLSIQQSDATIHVIGTKFVVRKRARRSIVSVLEGVVRIELHARQAGVQVQGPAQEVAMGEIVTWEDSVTRPVKRKLMRSELDYLQQLAQMAATAEDGYSDIQTEWVSRADEIITRETASAAPVHSRKPKNLTLSEIRRKYGRIYRINLTDGKTLVGFFALKNNQLEVITEKGTIRVSRNMLRDARPID